MLVLLSVSVFALCCLLLVCVAGGCFAHRGKPFLETTRVFCCLYITRPGLIIYSVEMYAATHIRGRFRTGSYRDTPGLRSKAAPIPVAAAVQLVQLLLPITTHMGPRTGSEFCTANVDHHGLAAVVNVCVDTLRWCGAFFPWPTTHRAPPSSFRKVRLTNGTA